MLSEDIFFVFGGSWSLGVKGSQSLGVDLDVMVIWCKGAGGHSTLLESEGKRWICFTMCRGR